MRVAFWTLGCRLNQYDTESLKVALGESYPVRVVDWREAADLYILNSCTVTGKADQECRRLARQVKRRQPASKVVVVGCYAQNQPEVLSAIPEIDGVIGNTAKEDVSSWLPAVLTGDDPVVAVPDFGANETFSAPLISEFEGRSRAFVKVQDGCDLRCTYCAIWQARGPGRSRRAEEVLQQIALLAVAGFRELILAGVHLGSYGRDLGERDGLVGLLQRCCHDFPDLRFRLSSIHPNEVTPALLALFAGHDQLRRHLHISLQSGSDSVLRRMRRPYRSAAARRAVTAAAAAADQCGIGADLIVGFPGETAAEFEETRRLVADLPLTYLHVFRYSPRPGTVAAALPDPVHPETVSERSQILRDLAAGKHDSFAREQIGRWREAVVESRTDTAATVERPAAVPLPAGERNSESEVDAPGENKNGRWRLATTDNYVSVELPDRWSAGTLVKLRPSDYRNGRLLSAEVEVIAETRTSGEIATTAAPGVSKNRSEQEARP